MMERREIEIDHLRWNPWNVAHIGRPGHNVSPQEVEEVVFSDQTLIKRSRNGRYLFLGPTGAGRILAAVLDLEGNGV